MSQWYTSYTCCLTCFTCRLRCFFSHFPQWQLRWGKIVSMLDDSSHISHVIICVRISGIFLVRHQLKPQFHRLRTLQNVTTNMIEMKQTTEPVILFLSPILFQFSGKLGLFLKKTTTTIGVLHPLITTSSGNSLLHNHLLPGVFKETPLLSGCAAGLGIFFPQLNLLGTTRLGWQKKNHSTKCHGEFSAGLISTIFFFGRLNTSLGGFYIFLYILFFFGG